VFFAGGPGNEQKNCLQIPNFIASPDGIATALIHQKQKRLTMKILKKVLAALGILIALILIAALFMKKDYSLEREITINKPRQEVFNYVKYLKNQNYFSTWNMVDPKMKQTFTGTDGAPGFISAWESDMLGNLKGILEKQ